MELCKRRFFLETIHFVDFFKLPAASCRDFFNRLLPKKKGLQRCGELHLFIDGDQNPQLFWLRDP